MKKRLLALMLTITMALGLAACSGNAAPSSQDLSGGTETASPSGSAGEASETAPNPASESASEASSEVKFVSMAFGNITIDVPDGFSAPADNNGTYISAMDDASILVIPDTAVEIAPSDWDEDLAADVIAENYGGTYSDLKLAAFDGDVNMNGNTAVYYCFFGTNSSGIERMIQVVHLYNADHTAQTMIALVHDVDNDFFTADISAQIINSITMAAASEA